MSPLTACAALIAAGAVLVYAATRLLGVAAEMVDQAMTT